MICKVKETIARYRMPLKGASVAVGVSGGADSMALLHVLKTLSAEFSVKLTACHVNHGIRGETADRDERFVERECRRLGVDLKILKADVPALAKSEHIGVEECGRRVRYNFFNSVDENVIIATAHTLSDRCETLILNEVRGAGAKGLCSIPAVRDNIVRPLIDCTRAEIEKYCVENSIEFITDETNFDDVYSRNRIRLNVMPELRKINPAVENSFLRLIRSSEDVNDFLSGISAETAERAKADGGYISEIISSQSNAVRSRVIFDIIKNETGFSPEAVHIEQVESVLGGGKTEIIGDTVVEVKSGLLKINPESEIPEDFEADFNSFEAETPSGKITAEIIHKKNLPPKQFVHNKVLDYDRVCGKLMLRNRRQGDKMRQAGSGCTKTLKKLFNEKHIENRSGVLILADELGVVWVQGIGCADRCKITEESENILVIGD